jgi:hypothetical protein
MSTDDSKQRYARMSLATDRRLAEQVEEHRQNVARSTGLPVSTNAIVQTLIRRGLDAAREPASPKSN